MALISSNEGNNVRLMSGEATNELCVLFIHEMKQKSNSLQKFEFSFLLYTYFFEEEKQILHFVV